MNQENNFNTEETNTQENNFNSGETNPQNASENVEVLEPEEQYEVRNYGGVIVFLTLIALALGGYIVFDKALKIEKPVVTPEKDKQDEDEKTTNTFAYDNYGIELPKVIDSVKDIYALYIKTEDNTKYSIYGRYTSEKEILVADITCKGNAELDYRTIDVDNNKFYFIIRSKGTGNIFELHYIDLNDLAIGAKKVSEFDEIFKKENLIEGSNKETYYSSQIYVKGDNIFYTSLKDKSLKIYDVKTKNNKTILNNILWTDYFVDKRNGHIFYLNNNKLYLTDLNGKNGINLKNVRYGGPEFWLKSYYNNKPLFGFENGSTDKINMYAYNYSTKGFIEIEKNVNDFNIRYNNIDLKATKDSKIVGFLYIA